MPPYPETVRFVAQVNNDFYAWLKPKRDLASRPPRDKSVVAADLIEPSQSRLPTETKPAAHSRDPAQWSDAVSALPIETEELMRRSLFAGQPLREACCCLALRKRRRSSSGGRCSPFNRLYSSSSPR